MQVLGPCSSWVVIFPVNEHSHASNEGQHHTVTNCGLEIKDGKGSGGLEKIRRDLESMLKMMKNFEGI